MDQFTNLPMDQWSNGPMDQWTNQHLVTSIALILEEFLSELTKGHWKSLLWKYQRHFIVCHLNSWLQIPLCQLLKDQVKSLYWQPPPLLPHTQSANSIFQKSGNKMTEFPSSFTLPFPESNWPSLSWWKTGKFVLRWDWKFIERSYFPKVQFQME